MEKGEDKMVKAGIFKGWIGSVKKVIHWYLAGIAGVFIVNLVWGLVYLLLRLIVVIGG